MFPRLTDCLYPCSYREFRCLDTKTYPIANYSRYPGVSLEFSSSELTEMTEVLAYDSASFVAEVGGALGLFLGFSFYLTVDLLIIVAIKASELKITKLAK